MRTLEQTLFDDLQDTEFYTYALYNKNGKQIGYGEGIGDFNKDYHNKKVISRIREDGIIKLKIDY